jgi:hypothetical protein
MGMYDHFDAGTAVGRFGIPYSRKMDGGGLPSSETGSKPAGIADNGNE